MAQFQKIQYSALNGKQQERYNFHHVSAVLAEYGYASVLLDDDWNGADFLAVHIDGKKTLRVQLKGEGCGGIWKKYKGKDIWVCFPVRKDAITSWYLYPHDHLLKYLEKSKDSALSTKSWKDDDEYYTKNAACRWRQFLNKYIL